MQTEDNNEKWLAELKDKYNRQMGVDVNKSQPNFPLRYTEIQDG